VRNHGSRWVSAPWPHSDGRAGVNPRRLIGYQRACRVLSSAMVDNSISVQCFDVRMAHRCLLVGQQRDRCSPPWPPLAPDLPSPPYPPKGARGGKGYGGQLLCWSASFTR
jgi:hypothetical protein